MNILIKTRYKWHVLCIASGDYTPLLKIDVSTHNTDFCKNKKKRPPIDQYKIHQNVHKARNNQMHTLPYTHYMYVHIVWSYSTYVDQGEIIVIIQNIKIAIKTSISILSKKKITTLL